MPFLPIRVPCGFLFLVVAGCSQGSTPPATTTGTTTAPAMNDSERVLHRCTERWKKVAAGDWIEAYDFQAPALRKTQTISDYLMGKANHRYESPETPELLELTDDRAYVYVACLWTPTHEALKTIKLQPGQSLTEHLEMVETWRKSENEWFYANALSVPEFFNVNPLVKKPAPRAPAAGG